MPEERLADVFTTRAPAKAKIYAEAGEILAGTKSLLGIAIEDVARHDLSMRRAWLALEPRRDECRRLEKRK